jgi:hypothetical protein
MLKVVTSVNPNILKTPYFLLREVFLKVKIFLENNPWFWNNSNQIEKLQKGIYLEGRVHKNNYLQDIKYCMIKEDASLESLKMGISFIIVQLEYLILGLVNIILVQSCLL